MITILVTMTFKPEFTVEAKELVKELRTESVKEIGCHNYYVLEDINDKNTINIIESFDSQEDLNLHRDTNHYKVILKEKLPDMIQEKNVRFVKDLE